MPPRFEPYLARRGVQILPAATIPIGRHPDLGRVFVVIPPEEPARFKVGIVLIAVARAVPLNFVPFDTEGTGGETVEIFSRMSLTIVEGGGGGDYEMGGFESCDQIPNRLGLNVKCIFF